MYQQIRGTSILGSTERYAATNTNIQQQIFIASCCFNGAVLLSVPNSLIFVGINCCRYLLSLPSLLYVVFAEIFSLLSMNASFFFFLDQCRVLNMYVQKLMLNIVMKHMHQYHSIPPSTILYECILFLFLSSIVPDSNNNYRLYSRSGEVCCCVARTLFVVLRLFVLHMCTCTK